MKDVMWGNALVDDGAFRLEQERLGRVWTLLGLASDLTNENDWFRATLGGRSVFVQRFGGELVGFENVCPHRFFPLRTTDRGNGPIVCGFHHWHYDRHGNVVGVPISKDVFGVQPREVPAKLRAIEIAVCGALVFGRFAGNPETLEQFLGEGWPILASLGAAPPRRHTVDRTVEANWRLMMSITLDDYHIVAVHHRPKHQTTSELTYWRFGPHSAQSGRADTLQSMAEDCRHNRYRPSEYKMFNIFPNLGVSLFKARPYWYAFIQQFVPLSVRQTRWRGWFYPTRFPAADETALDRLLRPLSEPVRARIVRHYIERTAREDHAACERLQEVAWQGGHHPILGAQETRVGWFQEAHAQAVGQGADAALAGR